MIDRRKSLVCLVLLALSGCAFVPRRDLEASRRQTQAVRSELAQAKDSLVRLRNRDQDLAARAVEDARRIAALEDANDRLEQSVTAYQSERDQIASAFETIKSQVRADRSSGP